MAISMAIGTSLSGIVYNKLGFYGAYGISSVLIIIGLVYGLLFVEEITPIAVVDENKSFRTTITEFFDFTQITHSLKTTFKKRPDIQRLKIIVLLIILMANAGTNNGSFWKRILYNNARCDGIRFTVTQTFFGSFKILKYSIPLLNQNSEVYMFLFVCVHVVSVCVCVCEFTLCVC